jgi:Single-strand binding protein family
VVGSCIQVLLHTLGHGFCVAPCDELPAGGVAPGEPAARFTNTGITVTNLRVAVTQRIQRDGEWHDGDTSFFKVNVWRGQAEHLADSLSKGRPGDGHRAAPAAQLGAP